MKTDQKVTIEITAEACAALRSFLMNDRDGTGEGYSDFILMSIDVRRQVAALTAENATLQMEIEAANIAASEWEETAAALTAAPFDEPFDKLRGDLRAQLRQAFRQAQDTAQDEQGRLREAQFKAVKDLKRMVKGWREYAAGDYCQTYNPEMGRGFRRAAGDLEDYINGLYGPLRDTIRLATGE